MTFQLVDRLGQTETLGVRAGSTVRETLLGHDIPPSSVLVLKDSHPVPDDHQVGEGAYVAQLIEGYDLKQIRACFAPPMLDDEAVYSHRRLRFNIDGQLLSEVYPLDLDGLVEYVERTVHETCEQFSLLPPGQGVLIGLSGGVDSSSLAIALAELRTRMPPFRLVATTFEDYSSRTSPAFSHAADLADSLSVEYYCAPATLAEEIFKLNRPLPQILGELMATADARYVMYIDHHTTRRVLEVFAERMGIQRIALGLHTTDLLAGLLNGWMTGYSVASIPSRTIGLFEYIYPLAFISKRELHLYHLQRTGKLARHSDPSPWELAPQDRSYYYYLADLLQTHWPGIELMAFLGHRAAAKRQLGARFERCEVCESTLLNQMFTAVDTKRCDACAVFAAHGYQC